MAHPFEDYHDLHGVDAGDIRAAAQAPGSNAAAIQALAGELEGDEKRVAGQIEGDIEAGTKGNPRAAAGHAHDLAVKGTFAVALLNEFASFVATFDSTVHTLNSEYAQQVRAREQSPEYDDSPAMTSQIQHEVKASLEPRYKKALTKLDDDADDIAARFKQGPTEKNVKALMERGFMPLTALPLFPKLHLSGAEKYKAYRAEIKNGLLPDFKDMTEAQRASFVKQNPDLVTYLMSIKKPDQQVVTDVVSLVLPHVDSVDAESDAATIKAALDGNLSPDDFRRAFGDVAKISSALATLTPWLQKHDLKVGDVPAAKGAISYLKTFAKETWPVHDKIMDYIKDDKHDWKYTYTVSDGTHYIDHRDPGFSTADQKNLMTTFANGFLGLSDERIGGGWDQLPKQMQEYADDLPPTGKQSSGGFGMLTMDDNHHFKELARLLTHGSLVPGDDLSKHLASTAMTSNSMTDQYNSKQAGGPFDPWDDGLTGDIMHLVAKNHDATTDLLTGHDVPPNYYGNAAGFGHGNQQGGIYSSNFTEEMFGHDWKGDSGGQVADMVGWIHGAHAEGGHETQLANRAYHGIVTSITDTDGGVFKHLMGPGGDSAAQYNRSLAVALTDATSDHFDEISRDPSASPEAAAANARLMTFLMSDHGDGPTDRASTAFRLQTLALAHEQDQIRQFVNDPSSMGPRELAGANARLSALLDASAHNAALENAGDKQDLVDKADAEHTAQMKIASGVVSTLAGHVPVVSDAAALGNVLVANLLQTPEHFVDTPAADVPPNWSPTGSHVSSSTTLTLLHDLAAAKREHPERYEDLDVPEVTAGDFASNPTHAEDVVAQALDPYYKVHGAGLSKVEQFYGTFTNQTHDDYDSIKHQYSVNGDGKPNEVIKAFLNDRNWGTS